jgi:hypothetical protein
VKGRIRTVVLVGLLLILGDVVAVAGLAAAVVVAFRRLLRSGFTRRGAAGGRAALIAAVTAAGLVVAGSVWALIASYEGGRPSVAQAAGTWAQAGGDASLRIFPDGNFTASGLPADTDSATGRAVIVRSLPADEHGTWRMTRGDGTWYLLCSLSDGPQFTFDMSPASQGDQVGAVFAYVQGQFSVPTVTLFEKLSPGVAR